MIRFVMALSIVGIALSVSAAEQDPDTEWKLAKQANGVSIYSRPHPGSHLKEFKAIGDIDATTQIVHKVIDDVDAYPNFMPYTAEARVIERKNDSLLSYQRISPKIVCDRDYTIRVQKKSWSVETGVAYLNEWTSANEQGPAEKAGVFRVKLVDGSWLLEPNGQKETRATYCVFTDSGITLPTFLANTINEAGISKVFAAVRKQTKDPKYQAK